MQPEQVCRELPDWAGRAWERLFEMVLEFGPDVVVLTARKMPRICESLRAHFGDRLLLISDLAVPFSSSYLSGARVAIIDDVVNFGSTLKQVAGAVEQHDPVAVKLFSLSRRSSTYAQGERAVSYAHPVPLDESEYSSYVRTVPAAISYVCKPYDLVFPLIRAQYRMPFGCSADIIRALRHAFDDQTVQVIPSPYINSPIRRVSLLLSEDHRAPRKLRIYFDDVAGACTLVPMVIPHHIAEENMPLELSWVSRVRKGLMGSLVGRERIEGEDAIATIALFTSSLDWFWTSDVHTRLKPFFDFGADYCSITEAKIIFGPRIETLLMSGVGAGEAVSNQLNRSDEIEDNASSPFLERFNVNALVGLAIEWLEERACIPNDSNVDVYSYVLSIVEALARLVGAEDPKEYTLPWPHTKETVRDNPYLRLRVGPTLPDIVNICSEIQRTVTGSNALPTDFSRKMSVALDALIDQGAVVPTFAHYEGQTFRIYRRGEAPGQDAVDVVNFAFAAYEKPLTVTRLAKVLSILSHSKKYHGLLESSARTRGLVAGSPKGVFGAEPGNIATFLRNTGQIRPVER